MGRPSTYVPPPAPAPAGEVELRKRQSYDAVRRLHRFTLEIAPRHPSASSVRRAQGALARIRSDDVSVNGSAH